MHKIRSDVSEGNERKSPLVKVRMRYRQRIGVQNQLIVVEDININQAGTPLFVPDATQFLLDGLRSGQRFLRRYVGLHGYYLIQKRGLIRNAPRRGFIYRRLLHYGSYLFSNQIDRAT